MQVGNTRPAIVPHPEAFRVWVRQSLTKLGVSAAQLSRELSLGRNTVADFLGKPDRGISMSTAHVITCKLHEISATRQIAISQIGDLIDG